MAARLEVSEAWLSRYLALARLPDEVVAAFASIRDLRELHARTLKPLLARPGDRQAVLSEARAIAAEQARARARENTGKGASVEPARVVARLRAAAGARRQKPSVHKARAVPGGGGITMRRSGRKTILEVPDTTSRAAAETAFARFLDERFDKT